ncbi:MAG: hypothetical protein M3N49_00480 [Candidatus Eremiobacteraeota bacterium]|nr:hypothetical protein [Candidatus Eremiobacteraeota bacterium]
MTYTVGKYESVFPESVTDEIILEGFRSLHQAMAEGFDGLRREMDERFALIDQRFGSMDQRIGDLDHRMMQRFDEVGGRLDNHERRIATLEAQR